jgi:hypothetical protein
LRKGYVTGEQMAGQGEWVKEPRSMEKNEVFEVQM